MAYELRNETGVPIKKDGTPVIASDVLEIKIEQLDEKNKSFVAVASTEDEDRDKDIIRQEGWKLTNFKRNPIIPWAHNYYGIPVAKSIKTWIDKTKKNTPRLLFQPKFDENDDESIKIFNKYRNGFLTSFSVGFQGLEFNWRDEENRWYGGREFTKQELLEISCVPVPANPHASTRLNYMGNKVPENLIQMGYPEIFAKTESGLFYPIMDIAMFSSPKEFEVEKGIIAVKANSLDENINNDEPVVGYLFDSNMFDDKTANEWIKDNAKNIMTTKYFEINFSDKGDISLDEVIAEETIKTFDSSVDMTKQSIEEDEEVITEENEKDVDVVIDNEKQLHEFVLKVENSINAFADIFVSKINELTESINKIINSEPYKKTIANGVEIIDNNLDSDKSENNDIIELDESLLTPGDNDKTNTDNDIEIDDELINDKKANFEIIGNSLKEKLAKNLKKALSEISGKID